MDNTDNCPPLDSEVADSIRFGLGVLTQHIHNTAIDKGWWDDEIKEGKPRNDAECIALMHSELSEALEALRGANKNGTMAQLPSDHIPDYLLVEEEYADVIIRILDHAYRRGWNVGGALIAKVNY